LSRLKLVFITGTLLLLTSHYQEQASWNKTVRVLPEQQLSLSLDEEDLRTTSVFAAVPPDEIARRRRTVVSQT
jgi:hypothetical protein